MEQNISSKLQTENMHHNFSFHYFIISEIFGHSPLQKSINL